jgi:hypothetical protein
MKPAAPRHPDPTPGVRGHRTARRPRSGYGDASGGGQTRVHAEDPHPRVRRRRPTVLALDLGAEHAFELLDGGSLELRELDRIAPAVDAKDRTTILDGILVPGLAGREAQAARDVGLVAVDEDPQVIRERLCASSWSSTSPTSFTKDQSATGSLTSAPATSGPPGIGPSGPS